MSLLDRLLLQGEKISGDLRDALAKPGVQLEGTIDGASTVRIPLLDPKPRPFTTSEVFNQTSVCEVDEVRYELRRVEKQADLLQLLLEDWITTSLRRRTGSLTAAAGSTTRGEFAKRLADEAGVPCEFEPGETIRTQMGRGVTDTAEDSWTCLQRLAREIKVRCCSDGHTLLFGSDAWLRGRTTPLQVAEFTGGIGYIDFAVDVRLPADRATFTAFGGWTTRPASPIDVANLGPASGEWLVGRTRSTQTDQQELEATTVELTRAQKPLPEPEHEAVTPNGADGTVYDHPGSTLIDPDFVAVAMAQAGKPYVFGAEASPSNASPGAFDCSELVEWALARVGIKFVDGSANQAIACRNAERIISIADGIKTYGALLFRTPGYTPGHVAISLGDGKTIEARGRAYGVGVFSATSGRGWTHAGLVPGIAYT